MFASYVFAENKPDVISSFAENIKLKDKMYLLQSTNDWEMSENGVLLLDIEDFVLNNKETDNPNYQSIINSNLEIKITTHKHLREKCKCYVSFLPEELALKYLKMIAQKTKSVIVIGMEHERGDNLYDIYCWAFDYRKQDTSDFESGYTQISEGVNFYPASRKDLLLPKEFIYACYESDIGHDNFYLIGCPAKVKRKWQGASMEAFNRLNNVFGIKRFPYWVDLNKYDLSPFRLFSTPI